MTLREVLDFFRFEARFGPLTALRDMATLPGTVLSGDGRELCRIARTLKAHKAKATFFFVGKTVHRYGKEIRLLRRAGHEIACHGFGHVLLSRLPLERISQELALAKEAFAKLGMKPLGFRPPYLDSSVEVEFACREVGFGYVSCRSHYGHLPNVFVKRPYDWERLVAGLRIPVTSARSCHLFHPRFVAARPELLETALERERFPKTLLQLSREKEGTGLSFDVY